MSEHKPKLGHVLKQAGIACAADLEWALAEPARLEGKLALLDALPQGERIQLENALVHVHEAKVDKAKTLILRNCVIHGNLVIGARGHQMEKIELDHVIVTGQILVHSLNCPDIIMSNVNTRYLTLAKSEIGRIILTSSNVGHLTVEFSGLDELVCTLNTFAFYTYYENQVRSVVFDFEQIDSRHLLADDKMRKKIIDTLSLFTFIDNRPPYFAKTNFDGNLLLKTFDFLQHYSKIGSSKTSASHYKYAATVHLQENAFMRLCIIAVGGFIFPKRLALVGLILILLYALFYSSPLASFMLTIPTNVPVQGLSFADAFYFSGVTFTTLGFGDIVPVGPTRLVAVAEGLTGIVTTSAFIISFVRKYVDM
jgi:hypothetical protein